MPGADAMFLNSRALGDDMAATVAAARAAGVTRLVALSAINADDDFSRQPSRFRGDRNKEVDEIAAGSGLRVGQPAPHGVRVELRRDVGGPDPGR